MKLYVLAAAALLAAPALAQEMTPADYVKTAGASDLYERQSSRIVLQTTADPHVRAFAQMMITQHTKSTADVKAAAMRARLHPAPPTLTAEQAGLVAELRAAQGPARDATYIAQQKTAHGQALQVQQAYAARGTAPALRRTAAGIVPVVQQHIAMLNRM